MDVLLPTATNVPPVPNADGEIAVQLRVLSVQALTDPTTELSADAITRVVASRISVSPLHLTDIGTITATRVAAGFQYDCTAFYSGTPAQPGQVPAQQAPFVGGFATQSLHVDQGSPVVAPYRAVTLQFGNVVVGSAGSKFAGVSISLGNPGGSIVIQLSGPMDPAKFNLGTGPIDTVGIRTDGSLVRSQDPTCISGQNAVGWCDQTGLVYVYPSVPGAPGLPGPSTVAGILNASIPIKTALVQDSAIQGRYKVGTNKITPFAGMLMETGTAGQSKPITVRGPVDPVLHSLGAGFACAVGVNASGIPVRATDPTCASGLNFIGFCDTAGTIFVDPRRPDRYNPMDFGAVGDNVTDDAPAFAAMFSKMSNGDSCFIPQPPGGAYYMGSPMRPDRSVTIEGAGMERCVLRFAAGPCLELRRAYETGAGDATKSRVCNLAIQGTRETFAEWAPNTAYIVGDKRRCMLGSLVMLNDRYQEDAGLHFVCTQSGTSGATQPEWSLVPGDINIDGTARWQSVSHAGIRISTSQVTVEKITVSDVTDDGIYAHGDNLQTFADSTAIRDCHVLYGDGNGIHIRGYDGNASLMEKNTVQNFPRGAMGFDGGFLSNTWTANDGAACRRSYVGTGGTSATTWLGNYWEGDTAAPKIKYPHMWFGASGSGVTFAPETNCMRATGSFRGAIPVESTDGTNTVYVGVGLDDGSAGMGSFAIGTDSYLNRTVWVPGDTDDPSGCYRTQWRNLFDAGIEIIGEKTLYGPGRHRYPRGYYIGSNLAANGRKAIFVTAHNVPPGISPTNTSGDCGRYLWRAGDVVYNTAAGAIGVTPGWIAARNGGWGYGRSHDGRVWSTNPNFVWFLGEGVEPTVANGKVYRLLRFEIFNGTTWVMDGNKVQSVLSTEPVWPVVDGQTVTATIDSTHRMIWECWGDVGMTWAVMPAPSSTVTT